MALQTKQSAFVIAVAHLIFKATEFGYHLTFGDAYRDPRATFPYSSETSKHRKRLAIDLNLFKNGVYYTATSAHLPLGEYWESIGGIWGGRFSNPDGNHYEWPDEG